MGKPPIIFHKKFVITLQAKWETCYYCFYVQHTLNKNDKNVNIDGCMNEYIFWFSVLFCNKENLYTIALLDCSRHISVKTFPLPLTDEEGSDQHPSLWHAAHSRGRQSQRLAPAEECWHLCPPTALLSLCGGGQGRIYFLTSHTAEYLTATLKWTDEDMGKVSEKRGKKYTIELFTNSLIIYIKVL